jgi:hypothetical protein
VTKQAGSEVTISVATTNVAGISAPASVTVTADRGVDALTASRLLTLQDAEQLFGSFAMVNRSPMGPVDLSNPTQAALNPVMAALQKCVLETTTFALTTILDNAIQDGLTNIGGVWATRNATGTLILTSGAVAIEGQNAEMWLLRNDTLAACVEPALKAQISFVASQLSPNAKVNGVVAEPLVDDTGFATRYMILKGKVLLNGGASGEAEQDLQLVWVAAGAGSTITQYILIRQGSEIDAELVGKLLAVVKARNLG